MLSDGDRGAEIPQGTGGDIVVVFKVDVEVIQLGVSHHVGDDRDFLLGVFDKPPGLNHAVGSEVFGKFDSRVL